MKKKIALLLTLAVASVAAYFIGYNYGNHLGSTIPTNENCYALTTIVTYTNDHTDEVVCMDNNGNEWVFQGIEDWMPGDICSMLMFDNGTSNFIYDDVIMSCKFSGGL